MKIAKERLKAQIQLDTFLKQGKKRSECKEIVDKLKLLDRLNFKCNGIKRIDQKKGERSND